MTTTTNRMLILHDEVLENYGSLKCTTNSNKNTYFASSISIFFFAEYDYKITVFGVVVDIRRRRQCKKNNVTNSNQIIPPPTYFLLCKLHSLYITVL